MALLAQIERDARVSNTRSANRRKLSLIARGATAGQDFATVLVHDLSETGVLIETQVRLTPGEFLEIDIQEAGTAAATVVWSSGHFFGCEFEKRLTKAAVSAAILRHAARPPAAETLGTLPASDEAPADAPAAKLPLAARLGLLVSLGAAAWGVVGLLVWAIA